MLLAASAAADVALVAGIIGICVGVAGAFATILVMAKYKSLESSLNLFGTANGELREQVEAGRQERHDLRSEFDQKISNERAECARVTGQLQGQVAVLTSTLGRDIASSVLGAIRDLSTRLAEVTRSPAKVDEVGAEQERRPAG